MVYLIGGRSICAGLLGNRGVIFSTLIIWFVGFYLGTLFDLFGLLCNRILASLMFRFEGALSGFVGLSLGGYLLPFGARERFFGL